MNAASMNTAAKATAKLESAKEARPPGGVSPAEHLPRKIFVCSPYRPTSQDEACRKDELEANIRRARTACRILSTLEDADELWVFGNTVSEGMAAEIKRAHELQKTVRNLPEPGRVVELLLKNISEQYHVPMDDEKAEEQPVAAESEEHNGK